VKAVSLDGHAVANAGTGTTASSPAAPTSSAVTAVGHPMKIDQIKIKQFGKAAAMFRAINAAGEVVQVSETREEAEAWVAAKSAACGGLQSPSGGLPWNA
jgi:hypothetical protein